ncbi:protein seele-like [Episyrphus balteatus]|uniref:protein seele-like n=1 Tax=Episyrphus balteatus TaxID=286459 RepID=UPI0024850E8E|nr:protein seele-like [Episyrphus balteatus]
MKNLLIFIVVSTSIIGLASLQQVDHKIVKCLVCKNTVQEMEDAISKIDPKRVVEVNGFRIDDQGNLITKTAKYSKSETYLTELMETVCSTMDNYVKVTIKKTVKLDLLKMTAEDGSMNTMMSEVDFIQDGDLNKSLPHYCLELLEDQEEVFLKAFMSETLESDLDIRICSQMTNICKDAPIQEDYQLEEDDSKDEL